MTRKFHPQSISYPTAAVLETYSIYVCRDRELVYTLSNHIFDMERGRSKDFEDGYQTLVLLRNRIGTEVANQLYSVLHGNVIRSLEWMRAQPVKK